MDIIFGFLFRAGILFVTVFLSHDFGYIALGLSIYIVASIFDHVDKFIEMANRFQQIEKRLREISLSQYEKDQELEKRLRWAEFKLGNVINRLNDDKSNPPDTDPAGQ